MVRILKDIYEHPQLGNYLGFKGGTACYLFYGLTRYSVDLDFDLILSDDISKSTRVEKEKFVFTEIQSILKQYSEFEIREAIIKRYTFFFLLSYGKGEHTVKIEISRRGVGTKFVVENYLGIPMRVTTKEDAFANKLVALTDRKKIAMRDVFDMYYFFSQSWDIREDVIKEKTGINLREYLSRCIKFVDSLPDKHILDGLGELLDEPQKDWVRDKLKTETIFLMKNYRSSLKK